MDLTDLETVDVFVISRHQRNSPHLGISRSISELSEVLQHLNQKVCIVSEGENFEIRNPKPLLVELDVSRDRRVFRSMWQLKLPHPVAAWINNISLKSAHPAIIIVPVVGLQSALLLKLTSPTFKKIVTLHTPYSNSTPIGNLYFRLQKLTLEYADYIVANSKTICEKYQIMTSDRVCVIPHYVECPNAGAKSIDFTLKSMNYFWIGALTIRKGADRLIKLIILNKGKASIDVVWSRSRFSWPFHVCLKILNRMKWVRLHNELTQTELADLIQRSTGLISTSRYESFGMTIVEAACHSKGLIAMCAPGVMETLPAISGGALYFKKIRELNKFIKCATEKEMVNLGRNAKAFCTNNYGLSVVSRKWSEFLDALQ